MTDRRLTPEEIRQADAAYRQWWLPVLTLRLIPKPEPELEAGRVMNQSTSRGLEAGTSEWADETGNYVDPEPGWDAGEPYADHAHGVAYYDTAEGLAAGCERWPEYRHVGPEPEPELEAG